MATAQKPDRGSLSRRNASLTARAGAGVSAAADALTPGGLSSRFDTPSKELLNKLLLALGVRALVTGIALTVISPTVPVFVGVNLLFAVPVVARLLYRRRAGANARSGGLGRGRASSGSNLRSRLLAALSGLSDLGPSSSSDSNRL